MERRTSRNLFLVGIVIYIIGLALIIVRTASTGGAVGSSGTGVLESITVPVQIAGLILLAIAWIGALVKLAKLNQWVWFILVLGLSGVMMLVYIFAGPMESKAVA